MKELHLHLWAKSDPPHPLWKHLLDVGAVTRALWPRIGPLEDVPVEWACALNALHDIGKADPWFQNKAPTEVDKLRGLGIELPERLNTTPNEQRHFRHEARSHEWLSRYLTEQQGWTKAAARVVTMAISGHHGTFGQEVYEEDEAQVALWNPWRESLARLVWDAIEPPAYAPASFEHASALGITLSGLLILSDWIASNPETFPYTKLESISDPREYFQAVCAQAQASVAKLGLGAPDAASEARLPFREVWPPLRELKLRPSQSTLEAQVLAHGIERGLAIIEEQMGAGKTEMAVYLAEHWNAGRQGSGVYIGLPTQATGNQMHTRYGKYLGDRYPNDPGRKARLVHGMAWLIDEETTEQAPQLAGDPAQSQEDANQAREWFRPLRRALLARDGVGTVDQAMMAALHVKFGSLRLLGLRSKVLVIDEAHAYDAFMSEILGRLLSWCRALQIPVVLLSATLSRAQKAHLVSCYGGDADAIQPDAPYPLMTFVSSGGEVRTLEVDASREPVRTLHLKPHVGALDDAAAIARLALSRIQEGGCGCVLMNTVKGAQEVYRAARQLIQSGEFAPLMEQEELILFHARFPAGARAELEKRVTKYLGRGATRENGQRPQRAIVIATQVIEQSLDIDFDVMLSQIAPLDLLLQRSGRLWRHREHDEGRPGSISAPVLELLLPPTPEPGEAPYFGVSEKVYARVILLRTQAVLPQSGGIELPRDFRPLIEAVYGDEMPQSELVSPAQFEQAAQQHGIKQREATGKAIEHLLPQPNPKQFDLSDRARPESPESEGANYLRASTRLGDDSRPVLLLHDAEHLRLAQSAASTKPNRGVLKAMFLQKTNVPGWWLKNLDAAEGHTSAFVGEGWLKHHVVIPLREGEWRSQLGVILRDDKHLGVLHEAHSARAEEADAGFMS